MSDVDCGVFKPPNFQMYHSVALQALIEVIGGKIQCVRTSHVLERGDDVTNHTGSCCCFLVLGADYLFAAKVAYFAVIS